MRVDDASRSTPLRIGRLARALGVSPDTLRHYESLGLIPSARRSAGGVRHYSPEAARQARVVRAALGLGFGLEELAALFRERARGRPPCAKVAAMAEQKVARIDAEIADLARRRARIVDALGRWRSRLAATPAGQPAGLLDALADAPP